jgi:hypothetical protein
LSQALLKYLFIQDKLLTTRQTMHSKLDFVCFITCSFLNCNVLKHLLVFHLHISIGLYVYDEVGVFILSGKELCILLLVYIVVQGVSL